MSLPLSNECSLADFDVEPKFPGNKAVDVTLSQVPQASLPLPNFKLYDETIPHRDRVAQYLSECYYLL